MRARSLIDELVAMLAPPRCAACGAGCAVDAPLCEACARSLERAAGGTAVVAGVGEVHWAAPYEGTARELVAALKFGARLRLAAVLAAVLAHAIPAIPAASVVVAVPAAPARCRRRGYDPAELLAAALAQELGLPRAAPLVRANGPRQVGRRRSERLASPPRVRAAGASPPSVLLVDDVLTTGATLRACAGALRPSGCHRLQAAVFARALGHPSRDGRMLATKLEGRSGSANRGPRPEHRGDG